MATSIESTEVTTSQGEEIFGRYYKIALEIAKKHGHVSVNEAWKEMTAKGGSALYSKKERRAIALGRKQFLKWKDNSVTSIANTTATTDTTATTGTVRVYRQPSQMERMAPQIGSQIRYYEAIRVKGHMFALETEVDREINTHAAQWASDRMWQSIKEVGADLSIFADAFGITKGEIGVAIDIEAQRDAIEICKSVGEAVLAVRQSIVEMDELMQKVTRKVGANGNDEKKEV